MDRKGMNNIGMEVWLKLEGRKYGGNGKNKVGWEEVWRKWEEQS